MCVYLAGHDGSSTHILELNFSSSSIGTANKLEKNSSLGSMGSTAGQAAVRFYSESISSERVDQQSKPINPPKKVWFLRSKLSRSRGEDLNNHRAAGLSKGACNLESTLPRRMPLHKMSIAERQSGYY